MSDEPNLGLVIRDGRIHHFSVSSLSKGAPEESGCPLRFWYRYHPNGGGRERENALHLEAKAEGEALHDALRRYERGELAREALPPLVLKGLHFVPPPGPDLAVERSMHAFVGDEPVSPLMISGIPVVGFIDLMHERRLNYGAEEPEETDPPGTVEILDWKRKGNAKTSKGISTAPRPEDLVHTIQMSGYGTWLRHAAPKVDVVRLSHGIFFAKGAPPRKVTKLHIIDECIRSWEYAEGVGRTLIDVARETTPERIPANVKACEAYGGCPHREVCPAFKRNALTPLFGEGDLVGLIDSLNQADFSYGAPTPSAPPVIIPPAPMLPTASPPAPLVTAESLAAEEAALRARQATIAAPAAPPPRPALLDKLDAIAACGKGSPSLAGEVAIAYAAASNLTLAPGAGYAGTGVLGKLQLVALPQIDQLLAELGVVAAPAAPVVTPPVTPVHAGGVLPPDAPRSIPALATAGPPAEVAPEAPKRTRGRPKGSGKKTDTAPVTREIAPGGESGLEIFVDCVPNVDHASLNDYADRILGALTAKYCPPGSTQDIRCAPADGPLGFGRWKGAVHELVRSVPPPDGTYVLDARGNEVAEIVADAMRQVCAEKGGLYVRGVR